MSNSQDFIALLESSKYAALEEGQANTLAAIMENTAKETQRMISEGTIASDVAQFTPFLMPMLRKVYPALIANELLGMQPLSGPTGFIYSLTNRYVGSASNGLNGKPGTNPTIGGPAAYEHTNAATQVILTDVPVEIGDVIVVTPEDTTVTPTIPETLATVVYREEVSHRSLVSNYPAGLANLNSIGGSAVGAQNGGVFGVLVELPENMAYGRGGVRKGAEVRGTAGNGLVLDVFSGPSSFDKILPNYSGSYVTANGETRGTVGNEMNEVAIAVERTQVEAKTRKLRAEYTIEMYQDLKAMHGVLADQELMNLMGYEIKAETDREVVDFVNSRAKIEGDFYMDGGYGQGSGTNQVLGAAATFNSGRWEIERYRSLGIKIADMSRDIGRRNKRGAANKLLVSPKVLTALEAIGGFSAAPVDSTVNTQNLNPVAGRFDNKFNVIVDNYADNGDYVTAIYKGSNQDSLGVYAPYTPVQIQKVTHVTTGQPALIAMSRYGLAENPFGGEQYATTMGINFNSTVLA